MSTKEKEQRVDIPLNMVFAYLEVGILLRNIQENFDITPKATCKEKSLQEFADKKLLANRKAGRELFAS